MRIEEWCYRHSERRQAAVSSPPLNEGLAHAAGGRQAGACGRVCLPGRDCQDGDDILPENDGACTGRGEGEWDGGSRGYLPKFPPLRSFWVAAAGWHHSPISFSWLANMDAMFWICGRNAMAVANNEQGSQSRHGARASKAICHCQHMPPHAAKAKSPGWLSVCSTACSRQGEQAATAEVKIWLRPFATSAVTAGMCARRLHPHLHRPAMPALRRHYQAGRRTWSSKMKA